MSNNQFSPDMSLEEREKKFVEMSEEDIDYSDIPPLDEAFFKNAKLVEREPVTDKVLIQVENKSLESNNSRN